MIYLLNTNCLDATQLSTTNRLYSNISPLLSLLNCFFMRTTVFGSSGGILSCSGVSNIELIINHCIFSQCKASTGGAIFFSISVNGKSFINSTCAYDCSATGLGQFSYTKGTDAETHENNYNFCSVIKSKSNTGSSVITTLSGKLIFKNLNISNNEGANQIGIRIGVHLSTQMDYCSFNSNIAKDYSCLFIIGGNNIFTFNNIIDNNCPSTSHGVFHFHDQSPQSTISNCFFTKNNNTLIYVYSGYSIIQNCIIDHISSSIFKTINSGQYSFQSGLTTTLYITSIPFNTHLSTYYCFTNIKIETKNFKIF